MVHQDEGAGSLSGRMSQVEVAKYLLHPPTKKEFIEENGKRETLPSRE